jgi:nicotinamide riboside transporter PnuC
MSFLGPYYGIDWLGSISAIFNIYLLSNHKRIGFIFGMLSSIFFLILGLMIKSTATIILNSGLLLVNVIGFFKWKNHT